LSPADARNLGTNFLEVAFAAETDSYLYQFFAGEQGIPVDSVGQMVAHFRAAGAERGDQRDRGADGHQAW